MDAIKIELEDIVHEIDYFLDSFEQSPENLNRVIDKIDLINNLLRKHSLHSIDELSEFRDNLAKKVDTTENIDNEIQKILFLDVLDTCKKSSFWSCDFALLFLLFTY